MTKKLYKKVKFKSRIEWLKWRKFGGSSASALFNANPYQTALDVYCSAVNPNINEREDDNPTISQEYGREAEELIRKIVQLNFKGTFKVISPNGLTAYYRVDKEYLTATIDGTLVHLQNGEKWVIEIKTHDVLNSEDLANWENHLPQNYFIQNLHYLVVLTDYVGSLCVAKLRFFKYVDGKREIDHEEIRYYWLPRESFKKDIAILEKVETDFYEKNILKKLPPKITIQM